MMTFGSLFSGIGGFDLGLRRARMNCSWQVEIDKKCQKLLRWQWGELEVPVHGDIKECGRANLAPVDLICGGFPCQDLSVAGRRAGLDGERSGLWYEFHRVIAELTPRWVLIENVPGLLSSNEGRDMAIILAGLEELGYGWAYRVLDAQYFGVAQRRRRVFIVGHLGEPWSAPGKVLFEPESVSGDSPPSREARQDVAGTLGGGSGERGWQTSLDTSGAFIPIANSLVAHGGNDKHDVTRMTYVGFNSTQDPISRYGGSPCLTDQGGAVAVLLRGRDGGSMAEISEVPSALRASQEGGGDKAYVAASAAGVRRLTPIECERLQGFPDNWTAACSQPDSVRYRQLGNAVCVPVAEWIGRRIVDSVTGKVYQ